VSRTGRQDRFVITRKQAALAATPAPRPIPTVKPEVSNSAPSRRINSECFRFRAYTKGGQGGFMVRKTTIALAKMCRPGAYVTTEALRWK